MIIMTITIVKVIDSFEFSCFDCDLILLLPSVTKNYRLFTGCTKPTTDLATGRGREKKNATSTKLTDHWLRTPDLQQQQNTRHQALSA